MKGNDIKSVIIGVLLTIPVFLLSGCTVIKNNPAIFGEWVGKPLVGEEAARASEAFRKRIKRIR